MQTFFMFLWSFILQVIPYKKLVYAAVYVIIIANVMFFTYNYSTTAVENGIVLINYVGE